MKLKKHDTPKPTENPEQLLARFEKRINNSMLERMSCKGGTMSMLN